jgi:hypothetical protein
MSVESINYGGWPNCYRLENGLADLVLTTDVGPRIIRFGFCGEENQFKEYPAMIGKTGGTEWRIYGGHRLWHAPEVALRTYFPDNSPVRMEPHPGFVRLIQPVEATTGIEKELDVRLFADEAQVRVTHRLRNLNLWPVELAPWALSVMAPGGVAIVPLPPRGAHPKHLRPSSTITLWPYTDMSDARWTWGERYVLLRQHRQATTPQKVGAWVPDGWVAYSQGGYLFVVRFDCPPQDRCADMGCSTEVWTDSDMLELETLGPLTRLEPGDMVEHVERWLLFRDIPAPENDAMVDRHVLPRVRESDAG